MVREWFNLRTMSEQGLLFLKLAFQLQSLIDQMAQQKVAQRKDAAKLLNNIADCLDTIEHEVRSGGSNLPRHVGSMKTYIETFDHVFGPLIGQSKARSLKGEMLSLFVGSGRDSFGDDSLGPMVAGFLELRKLTASGTVDELHTNSSIATLSLVAGQLTALAIVLEHADISEKELDA
jgi:hypothetical protein